MGLSEFPLGKDSSDYAYAAIRAALGSIPAIGHALSVGLETTLPPPLERRRERWLAALADVISDLQRNVDGLTLDGILEDERFVTAAIQAYLISLRTHQSEKINLLKSAVRSSVTGDHDDDQHAMFMRFVDELTPSHIKVLHFMRDPARWSIDHQRALTGSTLDATCVALPELLGSRSFVEQLFRDLEARGLILPHDPSDSGGHNAPASRTTRFGVAFLDFVGVQWNPQRQGTAPKAPSPVPVRRY